MVVVALVFAGLAALLHLYIFWLESIAWTGPRARRTFGIRSQEEAETTRSLAFNQGFYNLFLAVATIIGIVCVAAGSPTVGATLVFAGAGSMVAAGLVLLLSSPSKARAALTQLAFPLVSVVLLAIAVLSGGM
ncbi:DUF1304 domain-containing protein [Microbacterium caowuchunii]|uniref:DUF1304 domain-containing protein n=1 Tax=Microbacterium caowuchunii TaxID=2614638 RepID=A0A5N0TD81_9MICO|nr:DUF1304 domain-containing protein [Microbacterium caowuchunii]KAA9132972.1 DUF1304 domain-containing protein [Microbacterium caowuchunii]